MVMGSRLLLRARFSFFDFGICIDIDLDLSLFVWACWRASPLLIGLDWVGLDTEVVEEGGYPMRIIFFLLCIVITYHYTLYITIANAASYSFHLPSTIHHYLQSACDVANHLGIACMTRSLPLPWHFVLPHFPHD